MLRFLLDTDIVIYTIKRRPPQVRGLFNRHAEALAMSPARIRAGARFTH